MSFLLLYKLAPVQEYQIVCYIKLNVNGGNNIASYNNKRCYRLRISTTWRIVRLSEEKSPNTQNSNK